MRFESKDWGDFAGTMSLFRDYVTTEPLLPNVGDVRIQKIGDHVRVYQRKGQNWYLRIARFLHLCGCSDQ